MFLCLRVLNTFQVADELVAEFADPGNSVTTPDQVCLSYIEVNESIFILCFYIFHLVMKGQKVLVSWKKV